MSHFAEFKFKDSSDLDAFGRLRVSDPYTIFDSKQLFDEQPYFWDEELESGSGISSAHDSDTASTVITSTVSTAGTFTRQTYMRFSYQPGKSQHILMTGILDRSGGGTGCERRIGYFDDDNGVFFADIEGTINVVRRTNVTGTSADNAVAQSSWNIDPMDGTGPSGITADWTKTQIFAIDFEWLGVGRVRMALVIGGQVWAVHEFLNANVLDKVYMSTPNLPLRYQMVTTASSPASTMECICSSVQSEGGMEDLGVRRWHSSGNVSGPSVGTVYAVAGVRLKSTHLGGQVDLISAAIVEGQSNKLFEWQLYWNPTVAGTFTYSDYSTDSLVQVASGSSANTITGGEPITGGYGFSARQARPLAGDLSSRRRLGADISGNRDELVLALIPLTSNCVVRGGFSWAES